MLLDGDHFISKLTLMFDKSRTNGHVQITMKRYDGRSKPIPKSNSKKDCKQFFLSSSKKSPTLLPHL